MSVADYNGRAEAEADSVAFDPKRSSALFRQPGFAQAVQEPGSDRIVQTGINSVGILHSVLRRGFHDDFDLLWCLVFLAGFNVKACQQQLRQLESRPPPPSSAPAAPM